MFKINKKVFSVISGMFLASSLTSCSNNINDSNYNYLDTTAVYFDGGPAIIVPGYNYVDYSSGLVRITVDVNGNNAVYSSSDLALFYNDSESSSYEKALNFANAISNDVYSYNDVIYGKANLESNKVS